MHKLVIVAVLASVGVARAETTVTSQIAQLMVLEPADASYKLFHGAVWLDHDKKDWNYRWGGLQCKGRELADSSVQMLLSVFRPDYQLTVEYVTTDYKGTKYRCITGFTISRS